MIATYPYEGPDYNVATKLMEEARIREHEATLGVNTVTQNNNIVNVNSEKL